MLKSHWSLCVSFSRTGAGLCINHLLVWSIYISCTFPSGSPCRPSRVSPYTPSVLICCIRLSCDWWFHLCHHIACICYFFECYLSSPWYDWFLRRSDFFTLALALCFFLKAWVTANLFWSPGLFSVFWLISTMLWSGWSRFILCFPIPQVFFMVCCKCTNCRWYHCLPHVPKRVFFLILGGVFFYLYAFSYFNYVVCQNGKIDYIIIIIIVINIIIKGASSLVSKREGEREMSICILKSIKSYMY